MMSPNPHALTPPNRGKTVPRRPGLRLALFLWSATSPFHLCAFAACWLAAFSPAAKGAEPAAAGSIRPIETIAGIVRLNHEQAARRMPVKLRGVITYNNRYMGLLFLDDGTGGIFIDGRSSPTQAKAGTRVEVSGETERGRYTPIVAHASFKELDGGGFPDQHTVTLSELWRGQNDCRWVTVRAFIRGHSLDETFTCLKLADSNAWVEAWVDGLPAGWLATLNFGEVELSGPCSVAVTEEGVINRVSIWVPTTNQFRIIRSGRDMTASLPRLSIASVANGESPDFALPVRVVGTVTHVSEKFGVKLQEGGFGLTVAAFDSPPPTVGRCIEATGWLERTEDRIQIIGASLRDLGPGPPPKPVSVNIGKAHERTHDGTLVTMEGVLRHRVVADGDDIWILENDDRFFEAILPPGLEDIRNPMVLPGTTVRLAGVLLAGDPSSGTPREPGVLLRSAADIEVLSAPPWPIRRVLTVISITLALHMVGLIALAILHTRLKRRSAELTSARKTLEAANRGLEERVASRTHTLTQAHDALRESEERFRQLVGHIEPIFWMSTADNKQVLYLSPGFERICGVPVDTVYANPTAWFTLVHPADRDLVRAVALANPVTQDYELTYRIIRPDGAERWILDRAFPVRDASGVPYRIAGIAEDITERRQAEEELREQNIALSHAMPGIARLDAEGTYVHVNAHYAEMLGYRPDDLVGASFSESIHPADMPAAMRVYEQMQTTGKSEAEIRGVRKDRSFFWKHVLLVRIAPANTPNAGHHCFMRDITSRKLNELLLEGQKAVLETIASGAPCRETLASIARFIETHAPDARASIMLVTEDGRHLQSAASPSLPAAFLKLIDHFPIGPGSGACGTAAFSRQRVTITDVRTDEKTALVKESAPALGLYACTSTPVLGGDGSVLGTLALYYATPRGPAPGEEHLVHIATQLAAIAIEQDRTQRAEREAQDRYRQIIASALDAVITFDEKRRIELFNPAAQQMFQCAEERAIGRLLDTFIPVRQRALFLDHLARVGQDATPAVTTIPINGLRQGGEEFPTEASISETALGERKVYTAILRDLTEKQKSEKTRSQLEIRLRQAQKMEAIGTLAGGIAHDFNNILGAVMLNIELARGEIPPQHAAQDYLAALKSSSIRARDLVRQILAFSRQQEQQRVVIRLDQVVADAMKLIRAALPPNILIHLHLGEGGASIIGDPTQIHQVLTNLCANAAHAMRERGGQLDIRQQAVVVNHELAATLPDLQPGNYVRLSVSDNGTGMSPEVVERIFDPFFTTKAMGEGTGLGLAVVHGIMKDHDGAVLVESTPGQGSTFQLYFPAAEVPGPQALDLNQPIPRGRGQRVLVVDDEEALLKVYQRTLERLGYMVTPFTSPTVALEAFRSGSGLFDLVITDFAMPGMSGVDLSRELKRFRPDCPVIITTGYTTSLDAHSIKTLGLAGLIIKPATSATIGETVHRVLSPPPPALQP